MNNPICEGCGGAPAADDFLCDQCKQQFLDLAELNNINLSDNQLDEMAKYYQEQEIEK